MSKLRMKSIYTISDCWFFGFVYCFTIAYITLFLFYIADFVVVASAGTGARRQQGGVNYQLTVQTEVTRLQLLLRKEGSRVSVNTRSQRRMRRVSSAPYFDTTFSGNILISEQTFSSEHLVYIIAQLHFDFTLDTTTLVSRESQRFRCW